MLLIWESGETSMIPIVDHDIWQIVSLGENVRAFRRKVLASHVETRSGCIAPIIVYP